MSSKQAGQWLCLLAALGLAFPLMASARGNVKGYARKKGNLVRPHQRSRPDGEKGNNYRTPGNHNPNTGKINRQRR